MNANNLRSLAAEVVGRAALEERFGPPHLSALDAVLLEKSAATDPELLKVAATFDTGKTLDVYEKLGGKYDRFQFSPRDLWKSFRHGVQVGPTKADNDPISHYVTNKHRDFKFSNKAYAAGTKAKEIATGAAVGTAAGGVAGYGVGRSHGKKDEKK